MKIFKASYSTLSAWARGDYDLALGMYFKTTDFDTPAMQLGRALHDEWEGEIKATGHMPKVFGGKELPQQHKVEVFATRKLAEWLILRGKLDLKLPKVGFDWKSGTTRSGTWANGDQHKVYKVLYPELERFEYHAFNPYARGNDAVTVSIVHMNQQTLEDGIEWVVTHASDMKNYIEQNNLEAQFAAMPKVKRN